MRVIIAPTFFSLLLLSFPTDSAGEMVDYAPRGLIIGTLQLAIMGPQMSTLNPWLVDAVPASGPDTERPSLDFEAPAYYKTMPIKFGNTRYKGVILTNDYTSERDFICATTGSDLFTKAQVNQCFGLIRASSGRPPLPGTEAPGTAMRVIVWPTGTGMTNLGITFAVNTPWIGVGRRGLMLRCQAHDHDDKHCTKPSFGDAVGVTDNSATQQWAKFTNPPKVIGGVKCHVMNWGVSTMAPLTEKQPQVPKRLAGVLD